MGVRGRKRLVRDSDFSGVERSITGMVRRSRKLDLVCSECSSLLIDEHHPKTSMLADASLIHLPRWRSNCGAI